MTPQLGKIGVAVVTVSVIAIAFATLTPQPSTDSLPHYCLICGTYGSVDALLNVVLFIPLGIGLALCGVSPVLATLAAFLLSTGIELAQLTVIPGRDATVGDVFFNTVGATSGFAIALARNSLFQPRPPIARRLAIGWSAIWLLVQVVVNYGFRITLPETVYYGQVAHKLGEFALFKGVVSSITIDRVEIVDGLLVQTDSLRRALMRGDPLTARVVADGLPAAVAPIIRVADSNKEEVLVLGQRDSDLVYTIRTGATPLRVRRPFFLLRNAFNSNATHGPDDSVEAAARIGAGHVALSAQTTLGDKTTDLYPTAAYGWVLFLPFQWFIVGTPIERAINLLWMSGLLVPLGFWSARSAAPRGSASALLSASLAIGGLVLGLAIVPRLFGTGRTDPLGWTAALTGVIAGWGAALFTGRREV